MLNDTFTRDETRALAPYFTNTDRPVFALINLPETVKGALFARYSRSAKSLRRLFLDEFLGQIPLEHAERAGSTAAVHSGLHENAAAAPGTPGVGTERANK